MSGTVHALFVFSAKKAKPLALDEAVVGPAGLEGDFHARPGSGRQILLLSTDVLHEFGLQAGTLSENIVVDGLDVMRLNAGHSLRIGAALLEVTDPCEPCIQMDRIRPGLRRSLDGKRGMFARVVTPGTIRRGDPVET